MITEDIRYIGVNDHDIDLFEAEFSSKTCMVQGAFGHGKSF